MLPYSFEALSLVLSCSLLRFLTFRHVDYSHHFQGRGQGDKFLTKS